MQSLRKIFRKIKDSKVLASSLLLSFFAVGAIILIGGGVILISFELKYSAEQYQENNEIAAIEDNEALFEILGGVDQVPEWMQVRAASLMGILECERGNYDRAQRWFIRSGEVEGGLDVDPQNWLPVASMVSFNEKSAAFKQGYSEERHRTADLMVVDDASLKLDIPEIPKAKNAYAAYRNIRPFSEREKNEVKNLWLRIAKDERVGLGEMLETCERNQERLDALWNLQDQLRIPDELDYSALVDLQRFAQLAMIDSMAQKQVRNEERAQKSFDTAYRLLGFLEQNPETVTMLVDIATRRWFDDALKDTPMGRAVSPYFREAHLLPENIWTLWTKGEYWSTKKFFETASPNSEEDRPSWDRIIALTLMKHAAYYKELVKGTEFASATDDLIKKKCIWFRDLQSVRYIGLEGTEADGRAFARATIDLGATVMQWAGVQNVGKIEEVITKLHNGEAERLAKSQANHQEVTSAGIE